MAVATSDVPVLANSVILSTSTGSVLSTEAVVSLLVATVLVRRTAVATEY